MYWKNKARIQNAIALLPSDFSYEAYYWMQRRFGGLRHPEKPFMPRVHAAVTMWKQVASVGVKPAGKTFFEVGTGRVPCLPFSFWLMGAKQTTTVDLNPYLKRDITGEFVRYLVANPDVVRDAFGDALDTARFEEMSSFASKPKFELDAFLELCNIEYVAPGDAAQTALESDSIDIHFSYTVYEHIPEEVLRAITKEGNRLVKPGGLFIHQIDYSDHFSHSDKSISAINFLQFSDSSWDKLAGNRYMYMNRLRHDDYLRMLEEENQEILQVLPNVNGQLASQLASDAFHLDPRFQGKAEEVLCTTSAAIVSRLAR